MKYLSHLYDAHWQLLNSSNHCTQSAATVSNVHHSSAFKQNVCLMTISHVQALLYITLAKQCITILKVIVLSLNVNLIPRAFGTLVQRNSWTRVMKALGTRSTKHRLFTILSSAESMCRIEKMPILLCFACLCAGSRRDLDPVVVWQTSHLN